MRSIVSTLVLVGMLIGVPNVEAHPGSGIVVDEKGNVYFAFGPANAIYRVTPQGEATVYSTGIEKKRLRNPHHLVIDRAGNLYTASDSGEVVYRIDASGETTIYYPVDGWWRSLAVGSGGDPFTVDENGRIITVNSRQRRYVQLARGTEYGRVTLLADADWGHRDGRRGEAKIADLHSSTFVLDSKGDLVFTEGGSCVRRLAGDGTVSTIASAFNFATGLALLGDDSIVVADAQAHRICLISPDGNVAIVAGTGVRGDKDGAIEEATFDEPAGVAVDAKGTIYTLETVYDSKKDSCTARVREIKDGLVTTLAAVELEIP